MENATKALLMAAAILISIIILSIAVYLFSYFGDYAKNVEDEIKTNKIAQFNSQFLSYDGRNDLTVYDVITLANLAKDYNRDNGFEKREDGTNPLGYITVDARPFSLQIGENAKNDISEINPELVGKTMVNPETGKEEYILTNYKCTVTVNEDTKFVESVTITQ